MTRVFNTIAIVILALVIILMILWRASTNHLTYWLPIDYIGIIGFGMTLFTAWKVYFMNQDIQVLSSKYSMKLALPVTQKNVERIRKDLLRFMMSCEVDSTKKRVEILEIAMKCLSECEYLSRKTRVLSEEYSTIKETIKAIGKLCQEIKQKKQNFKGVVDKLYSNVSLLEKDIEKLTQDLNHEVKL